MRKMRRVTALVSNSKLFTWIYCYDSIVSHKTYFHIPAQDGEIYIHNIFAKRKHKGIYIVFILPLYNIPDRISRRIHNKCNTQ